MGKIRAPQWSYNKLAEYSDAYLAEKHPTGTLPIPIDDIVDVYHKIDVVPTVGLKELGFDAYVSRTMNTIYIEDSVYRSPISNRFRFSLAHELSHVLLHGDIIRTAAYNDIDSWKVFLESIPKDEYKWLEYQAYSLAGLLLVPRKALENQIADVRQQLDAEELSLTDLGPRELLVVAKHLGKQFGVSSTVIHKRACKDGFWKSDDIAEQ